MMPKVLWAAALVASALMDGEARAALSCTIMAAPPTIAGAYDPAGHLDLQGSFTINCTRAKQDKNWTVWVGLNQTTAQALAKAPPYADTLAYGIYTDAARSIRWMDGVSGGSTAVLPFSGSVTAASVSVPFYMRAPAGQQDKAAGTYQDTLTATLRLTDSVGQQLGTTTVTTEAEVAKNCSVGAAPIAYSVSYQAFRSTALVDSSQSVSVTCSKGTQVSLSLDQTTGVISPIGLTYALTFPGWSPSTTGTSSTGTLPQSFGLVLTLPAGQAGTCASGTCNGTATRQITITY